MGTSTHLVAPSNSFFGFKPSPVYFRSYIFLRNSCDALFFTDYTLLRRYKFGPYMRFLVIIVDYKLFYWLFYSVLLPIAD